MKKKKVTAPLSYDPGKGRPKEHLAYLNWQEMEALKRLNGNNMERGPRGLPSFPPADAIGSSSKASSSKSSKSTGSYTGGGKMGKSSSQAGAQKSSQQGSNVGAQKSSQQGAARSTNKASAGAAKSTAGTAKASQAAEQKAQRAGTKKASAPKAQTGTTKTVNVGPMGTPVSVKTGGTQIKGAIEKVKEQAYTPSRAALEAVRRGPGAVSGMIPGNKDKLAQERSLYSVTAAVNEKLGRNYSPKQVSEMARAVAGEAAGEDAFGRSAVANTMLNRIALASQDPEKYGYMGGNNFGKLMGQYDATGRRKGTKKNATFKSAKPGTENYQAGLAALADAANPAGEFARTASPKVLNATHYYNPDVSNPKWGEKRSGKSFETVGRHVFGNAESTEKAVSTARSNIDGYAVTPTGAEPDNRPSGGISDLAADGAEKAKQLGDTITGAVKKGYNKVKDYLTYKEEEEKPETALTEEQQKKVDATTKRGNIAIRAGSALLGLAGIPFAGALGGRASGAYKTNLQERLEEYAKATPAEKSALEKKDPSLIGWGKVAGIQSESPYSDYQSWATDRGLRGPVEGGRDSGIMAIKTPTTAPTPTASTVGTSQNMVGNRPETQYYWDLGLNIPSPTDPNYTQYQEYLRQRTASRAAMYGTS